MLFATTRRRSQGFTVIAAWGEDDLWDAALTYKGKLERDSAFWQERVTARAMTLALPRRVKLTILRIRNSVRRHQPGRDPAPTSSPPHLLIFDDYHCTWEGAAASVKHDPTGFTSMAVGVGSTLTDFSVINVGSTGTGVV